MAGAIQEWLNHSLKNIKHEAFKNVVSVEVEMKPLDEGQAIVISETNRVTIKILTSNGEKKQLKAITKTEAEEGGGRQLASDTGAFTTETRMYSDVLKKMESLLSEIGIKNYPWAECYHCGDNKFLLQDLCEVGYSIVPMHKLLDVDHALLVLKGLGKFHALSMVLKERGVHKFNEVEPPYFARNNPSMDNIQIKSFNSFIKTVKDTWGPEWAPAVIRLEKYFYKFNEKVRNGWASTKGKWDVLNHGDFTMRNMLFTYNSGNTSPQDVKFVDFQMCHYSNLGFDLANILYSSIFPAAREENLEKLLQAYTDSLVSTCKQLSYKGPLCTVDDVREALKSVHFIAVNNAFILLPFCVQSDSYNVQEKLKQHVECYSEDASTQEEMSDLIDYKNENVVRVLQYETRRCMRENIF